MMGKGRAKTEGRVEGTETSQGSGGCGVGGPDGSGQEAGAFSTSLRGAKESQFGGDLIPVGCLQGRCREEHEAGSGFQGVWPTPLGQGEWGQSKGGQGLSHSAPRYKA